MRNDGSEQQRAFVISNIGRMSNRKDLVEYAQRLRRKAPHLSDLSEVCLDKCIEQGLINGNAARLPEAKPEDIERVDLRKMWLRAIALTNICNLPTVNDVRARGYLGAMLRQINDVKDIGEGGFARLWGHRIPEYSAEYLMRKYYSDKLRPEQIAAIDNLLLSKGITIAD